MCILQKRGGVLGGPEFTQFRLSRSSVLEAGFMCLAFASSSSLDLAREGGRNEKSHVSSKSGGGQRRPSSISSLPSLGAIIAIMYRYFSVATSSN